MASYAIRIEVSENIFPEPLLVNTITQPAPKCWSDVVGAVAEGGWTLSNGVIRRLRQVETSPDKPAVELHEE